MSVSAGKGNSLGSNMPLKSSMTATSDCKSSCNPDPWSRLSDGSLRSRQTTGPLDESLELKVSLSKKHRLSVQQEPLSLSEAPEEFVQIKHTSVGVGIGIGINLGRLLMLGIGLLTLDIGLLILDIGLRLGKWVLGRWLIRWLSNRGWLTLHR